MSISYTYEVFECLLRFWMSIWLHTHTITTTDASPYFGMLAEILPDAVCKQCHYTLIEVVEPFKRHPMSMAYIYEVFDLNACSRC
jgi:hypothetical protein